MKRFRGAMDWSIWSPAKIAKHLRESRGCISTDGDWALVGVTQRGDTIEVVVQDVETMLEVEMILDTRAPDAQAKLREIREMYP